MKLEELLHDIKDGRAFGPCNAGTVPMLLRVPLPHQQSYNHSYALLVLPCFTNMLRLITLIFSCLPPTEVRFQ